MNDCSRSGLLAIGTDVDGSRYRKSGESDLRFMIYD